MRILTTSLAFLSAAHVGAQTLSYGPNTADLPAISGFVTSPSELEGALLKLVCDQGTYMTTMTTNGFNPIGGVWKDSNGVMIADLLYTSSATTFENPFKFDLEMVGSCDNPKLTIDLRMACGNNIAVVFDLNRDEEVTPGSYNGNLEVSGCGGNDVPAYFDYGVGINGATALGDLWLVATYDLSACDFSTPVSIEQDSDSTVLVPGLCDDGMDGDPHVKTWSGKHFDYMGECDLVLLHAPNFDGNGNTLDIHTRTTIRYTYSYIESAAISIGGEVLEVKSYGEHALNGITAALAQTKGLTIGGYPVYYTQVDQKKHRYNIVLSPKENITFTSYKDLVAVHLNNGKSHAFFHKDITGIMGSFDGSLVGRDGTDMSNDLNAYAEEWQVLDTEAMLFGTAREPQYPNKCRLPSTKLEKRRRLGKAKVSRETAEQVCGQSLSGIMFEECVADVLAFGDVELAGAVGAF